MNSLPVYLTYGYVSVYANCASLWGMTNVNNFTDNNWGVIDQLSDSAPATLAIGDTVFYNKKNIEGSVRYYGNAFDILKWKNIIMVENVYLLP